MAKIGYQHVTALAKEQFKKSVKTNNRFLNSSVRRNSSFVSRNKKLALVLKTLLFDVSTSWNAMTDGERTAWSNAGAVIGLNGWSMFVQDKSYRLKNGLAGNATPSLIYQTWVGKISLDGSASSIKLQQRHPNSYYTKTKEVGKKTMFLPSLVSENFALPLRLTISYKTNLIADGANPLARFYAVVTSLSQGLTINNVVAVDLGLSDSWQTKTVTLSSVLGVANGYDLFIELADVKGDLFFDNVEAYHSAQNWARDSECKNISENFSGGLANVLKNWERVSAPSDAIFESVYFNS